MQKPVPQIYHTAAKTAFILQLEAKLLPEVHVPGSPTERRQIFGRAWVPGQVSPVGHRTRMTLSSDPAVGDCLN
jgi:hypothetical protein